MSNITDKELLVICNLSNLKMEFVQVRYKEAETENYTNHTIYSLIENELNGQKTRYSIREKYEKI